MARESGVVVKVMAGLLSSLVVVGAVYAYLRWVWFFRDPRREAPSVQGGILAPVDGTVVYVRPVTGGAVWAEKLGCRVCLPEITKVPAGSDGSCLENGWIIGIYMSPLDVHYVYSPVAGRVDEVVHYQAARNLPMVDLWEYVRMAWLRRSVDLFAKRHHLENERCTVRLSAGGRSLWLVEIADRFVNKIRVFVEPGQTVAAGHKLSFICRGSQVDVIIPDPGARIAVKPGQRVYGSLSLLARWQEDGPACCSRPC